MRGLARRITSWMAIYAVALHVILLGLTPIAANGASVNPFAVICHSVTPASDETPGKPDLAPGRACEHCMCSAAAPPPAPGIVLIGHLMPTRLLQVLRPASTVPSAGVAFRPNLARGPPLFA
jgi:hypothetical protein